MLRAEVHDVRKGVLSLAALVAALLLVCPRVHSQSPRIPNARGLAMGSALAGFAGGAVTLEYNPAGLAFLEKKQVTFLLAADLITDKYTHDFHRFLWDHYYHFREVLNGYSELTSDEIYRILTLSQRPARFQLGQRLLEVIGPGSGFSLYLEGLVRHSVSLVSNSRPEVFSRGASRIVAVYGYARQTDLGYLGKPAFGMAFRYCYAMMMPQYLTLASADELSRYYHNPAGKNILPLLKDRRHSLSVDFGMMYNFPQWGLQGGMVLRNFTGFVAESRSARQSAVGIAFWPTRYIRLRTIDNIVVAAQVENATKGFSLLLRHDDASVSHPGKCR